MGKPAGDLPSRMSSARRPGGISRCHSTYSSITLLIELILVKVVFLILEKNQVLKDIYLIIK